ncbi:iron chelate uptake ABC transporter family permease subunit [Paenibacillus paeoniae]|uniref:Iron ABC transporter permease n=1 Tax=Paenibacillus paeoniae TaxID=2292705 RepID=A0A371P7Q7_9BACL|nr:iron chelate uptake ABC transporter family permease subunit [Paenibacillus paeoniae]REK71952.1 hypothetical protein DX130_19830 [Paenibacillus paeoniae]
MEQDSLQERSMIRLLTRKNIILLAGCLLATLISFLFALRYGGAFTISFSDLFNNELYQQIIMEVRLPLVLNTLLYGASMGVAGVLLQRATRFKVICPSTIGLVPAGVLAVAIAFYHIELQNEWLFSLIGVLGSAFGLLMAYLFSLVIPIQVTGMRRLVGGLVAAGVIGVVLFILLRLWGYNFMLMGYLPTGLFATGSVLIPISLICFFISFFLSGRMNGSSSHDPTWLIVICIVLAVVLTGTAITTLGIWAMVGLIASSVARWLAKTEDYRIILPAVAMIGAVIVSVLNAVSYIIDPLMGIQLHFVTGLIGLPVLVVLIWKEAVRYTKESQADESISHSITETTTP